jgi:NAD/NADP transhydrogenase alpha subunit
VAPGAARSGSHTRRCERLIRLGTTVAMQSGAGDAAGQSVFDGASFVNDTNALVSDADIVLAVQPSSGGRPRDAKGAVPVSFI